MDWEQVCADPSLKDLPYKIELNEWSQIVMSPASIRHVILQDHISSLLKSLLNKGRVLQEFPVATSENIKAPDVVWISDELLAQVRDETASPYPYTQLILHVCQTFCEGLESMIRQAFSVARAVLLRRCCMVCGL